MRTIHYVISERFATDQASLRFFSVTNYRASTDYGIDDSALPLGCGKSELSFLRDVLRLQRLGRERRQRTAECGDRVSVAAVTVRITEHIHHSHTVHDYYTYTAEPLIVIEVRAHGPAASVGAPAEAGPAVPMHSSGGDGGGAEPKPSAAGKAAAGRKTQPAMFRSSSQAQPSRGRAQPADAKAAAGAGRGQAASGIPVTARSKKQPPGTSKPLDPIR